MFYSKINFIEHNQMLNTMFIWLDGNHQSRKTNKEKIITGLQIHFKKKITFFDK